MELDNIFRFIRLTHDFQKVERMPYVKGEKRKENDVEHCYQLAMLGWYIAVSNKLPLDVNKVVKYGMLHDMVEVYAGDTYIFDSDQSVHESKLEREHQALLRLKDEFPEFSEMTDLIEQYESRADEESKFIYALDKLIAPLNIYLDDGRIWKDMKVTFDQLIENKTPKVKAHSEVDKYFQQLKLLLERDQDNLFHSDS